MNNLEEVWRAVKAKDDADFGELALDQKHRFQELVNLGGDATPLGERVAEYLQSGLTKQAEEVTEKSLMKLNRDALVEKANELGVEVVEETEDTKADTKKVITEKILAKLAE